MIQYVTGFMFSTDGKQVALISKLNPKWQEGKLNGVGGKIELNETANVAMAREFFEETGVRTAHIDWEDFFELIHPGEYKVTFFHLKSDEIFNVASREKEQVGIYPTSNLPKEVIQNLRWLIPLALKQ